MNKKVKASKLRPDDNELLAAIFMLSTKTPTGHQHVDVEACKHCKYFNENMDGGKNGDCMFNVVWEDDIPPNHYCSRFALRERSIYSFEDTDLLSAKNVLSDILNQRFGLHEYLESYSDTIKKTFKNLRDSIEENLNVENEGEDANVRTWLNALSHTEDWLLALEAEYDAEDEEEGGAK